MDNSQILSDILRRTLIDNDPEISDILERYSNSNSAPVAPDIQKLQTNGYEVITGDHLRIDAQVRHDSQKLAKTIMDQYMSVLKR